MMTFITGLSIGTMFGAAIREIAQFTIAKFSARAKREIEKIANSDKDNTDADVN